VPVKGCAASRTMRVSCLHVQNDDWKTSLVNNVVFGVKSLSQVLCEYFKKLLLLHEHPISHFDLLVELKDVENEIVLILSDLAGLSNPLDELCQIILIDVRKGLCQLIIVLFPSSLRR